MAGSMSCRWHAQMSRRAAQHHFKRAWALQSDTIFAPDKRVCAAGPFHCLQHSFTTLPAADHCHPARGGWGQCERTAVPATTRAVIRLYKPPAAALAVYHAPCSCVVQAAGAAGPLQKVNQETVTKVNPQRGSWGIRCAHMWSPPPPPKSGAQTGPPKPRPRFGRRNHALRPPPKIRRAVCGQAHAPRQLPLTPTGPTHSMPGARYTCVQHARLVHLRCGGRCHPGQPSHSPTACCL